MALKYCEFVPAQHRNKVPGKLVFLDSPDDKHPMAICEACVAKLKKMRPDAIVLDPKKEAAEKAAAEKAKRKAEADERRAAKKAEEERLAEEQRAAEAASAAEEAELAGDEEDAAGEGEPVAEGDAGVPDVVEEEKPEPPHGA